jgi:DNA-binding MarR family transcriptional regulator
MFNENDIKFLTVLYFENQKKPPKYFHTLNQIDISRPKRTKSLTKLEQLGYIKGFLGDFKTPNSNEQFKSYDAIWVTDKGAEYIANHFKKDKCDFKGIAEQAAIWGGVFINILGLFK